MSFFDDLQGLYTERGAQRYEINGRVGGVTQLQHALQCAAWAAESGSSDALVAAALLHDLGHLLHSDTDGELDADRDDVHQYLALPLLRPHLPAAVLEPIKLHVDAKRYLCGTVGGYWDTLSDGSKRSLELQGGPFTAEEAEAFIAQPHAAEAVQLRRWDDLSKDPARVVPGFEAYRELLGRLSHPQSQRPAAT
jgi:phosphonate degradation associated HDIG domain protein